MVIFMWDDLWLGWPHSGDFWVKLWMENEWDIGWCILRCPQTWLENLPTIDGFRKKKLPFRSGMMFRVPSGNSWQFAIENGHRNSGFIHWKLWFSIVMLRVSLPEGKKQESEEFNKDLNENRWWYVDIGVLTSMFSFSILLCGEWWSLLDHSWKIPENEAFNGKINEPNGGFSTPSFISRDSRPNDRHKRNSWFWSPRGAKVDQIPSWKKRGWPYEELAAE